MNGRTLANHGCLSKVDPAIREIMDMEQRPWDRGWLRQELPDGGVATYPPAIRRTGQQETED